MKSASTAAVVIAALAATVTAAAATAADTPGIVRYPIGTSFPIARAVEIPAGFKLIFHSGFTPTAANPQAKEGTPEYWGDTKTQALSTFKRMQDSLKDMGLGFGDVVKMNVFLVGDPATGKMDFKGFMEAYTQFFGTPEQPNLPARSAVQVAGLASPGVMVEVEVVLAQKSGGKAKAAAAAKKPS
jgi:enamine deaminase RidA (YjgF/YER057c/UK114 family)